MKTLKTMFLSCLVLGLCSVMASCSDDDDELIEEVEDVEETAVITVSYTDSSGTDLLTSTVSYNCEQADYPTTNIEIVANKGLASLTLGFTGGNDDFKTFISNNSLSSIELVGGNTTLSSALSDYGLSFTAPTSGATSYSFPITTFYALMSQFGITDEGSYHQLDLSVTDAQGNTASATQKVTITEDEYSISVTYVDEEGTDLLENGFIFNASTLDYPTTSPLIEATKGIASVQVTITGGNETFSSSVTSFFGETGTLELVGNTTLPEIAALMGVDFTSPESGATEYEFPIAVFYQLMALFGATDTDSAHTFAITVTDSRGHTYTASTLSIQVYDLGISYLDEDGTDLLANGVTMDEGSYPNYPTTAINITSSYGFQSVTVKIIPGSDNFTEALALLQQLNCDLTEEYELIGDETLDYIMGELYSQEFPTPESGATSYEFPISSFYALLAILGPTDDGTPHQFIINVTDVEGYTISSTLNVTLVSPIIQTYTAEDGTVSTATSTTSVTVSYDSSTGTATYPSDTFVYDAHNGIAKLEIRLTAGSSDFKTTLSTVSSNFGVTLTSYYDLVADSVLSTLLGSYGYTAPVADETSYSFPLTTFYQFMAPMGDTTTASPKYHTLALRITDNNGNTLTKSFRVTVNVTE